MIVALSWKLWSVGLRRYTDLTSVRFCLPGLLFFELRYWQVNPPTHASPFHLGLWHLGINKVWTTHQMKPAIFIDSPPYSEIISFWILISYDSESKDVDQMQPRTCPTGAGACPGYFIAMSTLPRFKRNQFLIQDGATSISVRSWEDSVQGNIYITKRIKAHL